eukprot:213604-Chlamydomonas_euryale.AAC.37
MPPGVGSQRHHAALALNCLPDGQADPPYDIRRQPAFAAGVEALHALEQALNTFSHEVGHRHAAVPVVLCNHHDEAVVGPHHQCLGSVACAEPCSKDPESMGVRRACRPTAHPVPSFDSTEQRACQQRRERLCM